MPYETKPFPFDPKSISGISENVLVSHYENNYGGAVRGGTNDVHRFSLNFAACRTECARPSVHVRFVDGRIRRGRNLEF